ncbi:MAG: restriction endonuclease subunit S [Verrucomicrobiae bacterium]|nr:restriction endonuclease subunit S [Verrucomicrobiae bacterium]
MSDVKPPEEWIESSIGDVNFYKSLSLIPKKYADERFELYSVPVFPTGKPEYLLGSEIGSSKQQVEPNDVLLCKINPRINRVWSVKNKLNFRQIASSEWIIIRQPFIDSSYIRYLFSSQKFRNKLCSDVSGVGGSLTRAQPKKVATYKIPIAPLAEQKEIAKRLDELLGQVDTLKTRLAAIPAILKRFRQSTLAAAVSGKLTEDWRGENGYVQPAECDEWKWCDIPASWSVVYYEKAVNSRLGKMLDKSKNTGTPTSYLGNINVRWFYFDLEKLQEILVSVKEITDLSVRKGDVLICEGGEPGRAAIWNSENIETIIFQKALHRARVSKSLISEWLVYNLKNDADNQTLQQLFTGTTIKHLTGKALRQYPLRIPPIEEQKEIVHRVEELFAFADQIEQRVKDAQARVNHLTQSILAKAFRGELTADWRTQHPELITGENSAEALLRRIKAERATTPKPTRRGKRKRTIP